MTSVVTTMMLLQLLFLIFLQTIEADRNVQVTTPLGILQGSTLTTRLGKTIYSFRGIRYAQAPINELRFKPPVPTGPWSGVYDATADGPVCPQPTNDPISEDCLFLNVYTTKLSENGVSPKRPVIIFLHAGGYYSGTGRSNWAGPQYLLDQDVVLVTLNYRLGALGFLSLGKVSPGNYGLKDQVVAMKWVKNNIASFGGNPDSITIYGYSAGSWSVSVHLVSPMSRGLFHKAIMGSGSTLGQYPFYNSQMDLAKRQARFVGCPDTTPREILACLKTKSAEELGNSLIKFTEFGRDPIVLWTPVIEEDFGQERFLTDHPVKLIKSGNFYNVPVVTGITKDEFGSRAYFVGDIPTGDDILNKLNNEFEKYAPIAFAYERNTPKSREVSRALRKCYFGDKPINNSTRPSLAQLYADSVIGFPVHRGANLLSEKCTKPVYYYEFAYQGRYSHAIIQETNTPYGVVHHDDLIYLFYVSSLFPFFNQTDPESKTVETLTSLWANFAKTGNPAASTSKSNTVNWEPYNIHTKKYLEIGKRLVVKDNLYEDRYACWRKLYPL